MDLVPPCRSDTAGDLTLRAEKCVKLPLSSNHLRPEKREISYARYYTSYNAKIYVILVVGDIVTCQKWMDKSPPNGPLLFRIHSGFRKRITRIVKIAAPLVDPIIGLHFDLPFLSLRARKTNTRMKRALVRYKYR